MHVVVGTTAHPPGDVRVGVNIVGSLLERGIRVSWVGPPSSTSFYSHRLAGVEYFSLPSVDSRRDRLLGSRRLARGLDAVSGPVDWVYCPDPDAFAVAHRFAVKRNARLWFDIHEQYEVWNGAVWLGPLNSGLTRNAMNAWIRRMCQRAELVTSPSPAVLEGYGASGDSAVLLPNAARLEFGIGSSLKEGATATVLHGKPAVERGTGLLGKALDILNESSVSVEILVMGGVSELAAALGGDRATELSVPSRYARFVFHEPVEHEDMPKVLSRCQAAVVGYMGPLATASFPNRLFECMALGLPILCPVQSPLIVEVVEKSGCGFVYDNDDPATLARGLRRTIEDPEASRRMGQAGRSAFVAGFNWEGFFGSVESRLWS